MKSYVRSYRIEHVLIISILLCVLKEGSGMAEKNTKILTIIQDISSFSQNFVFNEMEKNGAKRNDSQNNFRLNNRLSKRGILYVLLNY